VIGRTPQETVKAWASSFQQALSCITLAQFHVDGYRPVERPSNADLNGGLVAPLNANPRLSAVVILRYRILRESTEAGAWMVRVVAYRYALFDEAERDILSYEWHPEGTSWVTWPHAHIGGAMLRDGVRLSSRMHLPTRQVAIEDVIRLAIVEFGVRPRRSDWASVLARTSQARMESPLEP
jgi:hypothetical protein